jgi:hypothetical protein
MIEENATKSWPFQILEISTAFQRAMAPQQQDELKTSHDMIAFGQEFDALHLCNFGCFMGGWPGNPGELKGGGPQMRRLNSDR